jgi:hypothetical protein
MVIPPEPLLPTQLGIYPRTQEGTTKECQPPCHTDYNWTVVWHACGHLQSGGPLLLSNQVKYAFMRSEPSYAMGEHLFGRRRRRSKVINESCGSELWGRESCNMDGDGFQVPFIPTERPRLHHVRIGRPSVTLAMGCLSMSLLNATWRV